MKRVRYTSAQKFSIMNKYKLLTLRVIAAIILAAVIAACIYASTIINAETLVGTLMMILDMIVIAFASGATCFIFLTLDAEF